MRSPRSMLKFAVALFAAALIAAPAFAGHDEGKEMAKKDKKADQTLHDATAVLEASVSAPDKGIPKDLLQKAECVGVFPGLKKGAFIVGGEFGRGVFTCRQKDGTMGAPAFFTMGGPSIGWQFGGEEADIVLLVMNDSGMKHLLEDKFTLGGQAAAVAGPVGRNAKAATDLQMHAQLLSWSRSRGAFLGASLDGIVVKQDHETTQAFYDRKIPAEDILVKHAVATPERAAAFVRKVNKEAERGS